MPMKHTVFTTLAIALAQIVSADDKVDFAKSIKPIFESRCLECHGTKKQKADLRLDSKDALLKGGKDGKVVVEGKADESDLFKRITLPKDHDDIMPPKGEPLTKDQTELIKKWINEGLNWPEGLVLKGEEKAGEPEKKATATASTSKKKKDPATEFAHLTPTKDTAAEEQAIKKLATLGISVRPIAQNLQWKEATVRPQDTNKVGEALAELKNIPSLIDLNLAGQRLKDDDLKNIADLTNLQRLHLENNPISDGAMAYLKKLVNLEYLNLYNTQVGDSGLENLKGMTNLANLYLWETKVTDEGAANLKKSLVDVTINRGEELKLIAKLEEKKEEKKDDAKKEDAKKEEAKKDEKKEDKKDIKADEKKADEKKADVKAEDKNEKKEEKKDDKPADKKDEKKA